VIPNYFDEADFIFSEDKDDYFFYIGRMIYRKGIETALLASQAVGKKLIVAGQGEYDISSYKHAEFIGYVEPDQRSELMAHATAVYVPTIYLEAFGGVNVEAQLCGTPVITTNFGVFPETVRNGETGFLCNTLNDFVRASKLASLLDPVTIREHAERYLMKNVMWEYQVWFDDLYQWYLSATVEGAKGWSYIE
jgi:glycosyltransferase involved in cell wall biosynthesis